MIHYLLEGLAAVVSMAGLSTIQYEPLQIITEANKSLGSSRAVTVWLSLVLAPFLTPGGPTSFPPPPSCMASGYSSKVIPK